MHLFRPVVPGSLLCSIVIALASFCEFSMQDPETLMPVERTLKQGAGGGPFPLTGRVAPYDHDDNDDDNDDDDDDDGRADPSPPLPQPQPLHRIQIRSKQHYCGQVLVDVLKMMCKGRYNSKQKRDPSPGWYYRDHQDRPGVATFTRYLSWPEFWATLKRRTTDAETETGRRWSTHPGSSVANSQGSRKRKRGIVEECCKSPCTANTLLQYCEASH